MKTRPVYRSTASRHGSNCYYDKNDESSPCQQCGYGQASEPFARSVIIGHKAGLWQVDYVAEETTTAAHTNR